MLHSRSSKMDCGDIGDYGDIWTDLGNLRSLEQLCDGTIVVKGKRFQVHKAIMAANSQYFQTLFTAQQNRSSANDNSCVELTMKDLDENIFEDILSFIYSRRLDLDMNKALKYLEAARKLMIHELVEHCSKCMMAGITPLNCIRLMQFGRSHGCENVLNKAKTVLRTRFDEVLRQSEEFDDLTLVDLQNLLSDDHLNVRSEEDCYHAVAKWISLNPEERQCHIHNLLSRIRMGLFTTNFLKNIACTPYVQQNVQCRAIIDRAKLLSRTGELVGVRKIDLNDSLVRPRIPQTVMFAVGGWTSGSPTGFFETYDTRADRWFNNPDLEDTTARAYHALVTLDQLLYVLGGFDGTQYYSNVRCFNPVTQTWREVAPMYNRRCYVCAVTYDGLIYAIGGYDGRWRLNSAECYNPSGNQWSLLPCMNRRRSDAGAAVLSGRIYVIGGFDGEHCQDSAEVYDVNTQQWTILTQMTSPRSGLGVVVYHGAVYALGGFDGNERRRDGEKYCVDLGYWLPVKPMSSARSNFGITVIDDMIMAVGGFNGVYTIPCVECYDGQTNEWYQAANMAVNRSALSICTVSGLPNAEVYTLHGQCVNP